MALQSSAAAEGGSKHVCTVQPLVRQDVYCTTDIVSNQAIVTPPH
jgi:hypothetical protein